MSTSKKILLAVGVIFIAAFIYFGTSSSPETDKNEPVTIGIAHHRQQNEIIESMKEGLKELGYENITYEQMLITPGPTTPQDNANAIKGFISKGVDLIFTPLEIQGLVAVDVTKEMGSDIPIVFGSIFHDPVRYGMVGSLRSSGNNATGVILDTPSVLQRQLDFSRRINPDIKRIGVFSDGFILTPIGGEFFEELKIQADRLGFTIVEYKTTVAPPDAEEAWYEIAKNIKPGDIDAIYHIPGHHFDIQEVAEAELAKRLGILHVAPIEDLPNGGHFGYSADYVGTGKQMAVMIDKVLSGRNPSDIPVEFIKDLILVLYSKRAGSAGIEFPSSMVDLASAIIE